MKKLFLSICLWGISMGVFAQENIQHTVIKDDTITSLARKYNVSIYDIYQLNPNARNGIRLGEVLLIPNVKTTSTKPLLHQTAPKETLFGIAKKYGITLQAIEQANQELLKNGLQPGMELVIPIEHKTISASTVLKNEDIIHIVQPKETLYRLTQRYGVSENELISQNPQLKEGLKMGDTLRIRLNTQKEKEATFQNVTDRKTSSLGNTSYKGQKQKIAILIPFNAKMAGGSSDEIQNNLKNNKLLNIAVDFYSGALMAVEDIKAIEANLDITFYDSEETSSTSSVEQIINSSEFQQTDLVIGPFFQTHSEKTARLLKDQGVVVVSPISKEGKAKYENLYLSVPSSDLSKTAMLNYLKAKKQHTIALVDRKKQTSKNFISQNYPGISFVNFTEEGRINTEHLKSLLNPSKTNYIILETESSSMVINTTKILMGLQESYDIKLVALDRNIAFESDEVKSQTLANLNLHYPTHMKETTTNDDNTFYERYRIQNGAYPSYAAVRGYDVVHDALLRAAQKGGFEKTTDKTTEEIDSKFIYTKSPEGGYQNTGVYILYYDNDLTIKEAE